MSSCLPSKVFGNVAHYDTAGALNKRLMGASNSDGTHDPADAATAAYLSPVRYRRDELDIGVFYRLLADGRRSFHRFLHCSSCVIHNCAGGYCNAEKTVGALCGSLWSNGRFLQFPFAGHRRLASYVPLSNQPLDPIDQDY